MELKNKKLTFKASLGKEVKVFIKTNVSGKEVKREVIKYASPSNKYN